MFVLLKMFKEHNAEADAQANRAMFLGG